MTVIYSGRNKLPLSLFLPGSRQRPTRVCMDVLLALVCPQSGKYIGGKIVPGDTVSLEDDLRTREKRKFNCLQGTWFAPGVRAGMFGMKNKRKENHR